jgi:type IV pilus assembly protein PilM
MAKNESILAVDIGACSLKMASFTFPGENRLVLENFAYTEFAGDLDAEDYKVALREALHSIIAENNFTEKKVYFSFSGQSAFIRFVKLPPMGDEEGRVKQVVEFEARQNVPYPIEEVIWDYQLIGDIEDGSEIETMFVVVKNDIINDFTEAIEEVGKEPLLVDVAPTVAYNAARANAIGGDDCAMILNIGGRCSSLIFIDSGRFFVRTIPIAGFTVTQQISKEFGISFEDAEELKKKHGFVALGGAYEEPDSEVASTVSKIVRNVMTRLHGEINRSINVYRSQRKGTKPTKLYLAGGSSVMAFTPRFFSEKLKIPVEYMNPFQVVSLASHIDREALAEVAHMFSEVIGLGLRYAAECPIEISLIPPSLRMQHEIRRKAPYFYASAASLIFCLLIFLWSVGRNKTRAEKMAELADSVRERTNDMLSNITMALEEKSTQDSEYNQAKKKLANRDAWIKLLNELQSLLPDNTWLTKIAPGHEPSMNEEPKTRRGGGAGDFGEFGGMFLPTSTRVAAKKTSKDIEWLEIEGHTLILDKRKSMEQILKENIVKSPFFTDDKTEVVPKIKIGRKGINNLSEFTMTIKLKKPIKQ